MRTLVVEDDAFSRAVIEELLATRGCEVTACPDAEEAWALYDRDPTPLVVLDWMLPGMDGLELCRRIRAHPQGKNSVVLMLTARDSAEDLQQVLDAGADDYLFKPLDERLLGVRLAIAERRLREIDERRQAEDTVRDLRRLLDERARYADLIGKSHPMRLVYELIQDVARVDSTVLIEGETGTGKELVARAVHAASPRSDGPFVAVNCAGLTESLIASQLFGHRRGAFTGAIEDHKGYFETAHGGTLFLDEIGDVPNPVQTNLLRVIQEKEILRLGESKPRKVNVRLVVATHRNLAAEVERGSFRADLLYRIRVARIHLPPLRERREDIPLLVASFLQELRKTMGKPIDEITNEAMRALLEYRWPGNVRELKSAIEFAVIRARGTAIEHDDLPPEVIQPPGPPELAGEKPAEEHDRIRAALEAAHGNRVAAARMLGISRSTLYRRLAEMGIDTDDES